MCVVHVHHCNECHGMGHISAPPLTGTIKVVIFILSARQLVMRTKIQIQTFIVKYHIPDRLLREYYNQDFLLGVCPSRLFRTFNEANILLIVYFDNMFDLQSQKLQLESV